ncbi:MAG: hypothetical protein LBJ16_01780 [Holosporaceae bacterium]|nr:hypothetical protein [Holosporaceae bacterium]
MVHEDPSTEATQKLPKEHMFRKKSIVWWILTTNAACYLILGGLSFRMLPHAITFGLPLIVHMCMKGNISKSPSRIMRIVAAFFMTMGVVYITMYMDAIRKNVEKHNASDDTYETQELFGMLDAISDTPVVIMAGCNEGPELLYRTKHSVVSAPYHRQKEGIISSHQALQEKFDEDKVKKILAATNSRYIFIRKSTKKPQSADSLEDMVNGGRILPPWLDVVKIPARFHDVVLLKVNMP